MTRRAHSCNFCRQKLNTDCNRGHQPGHPGSKHSLCPKLDENMAREDQGSTGLEAGTSVRSSVKGPPLGTHLHLLSAANARKSALEGIMTDKDCWRKNFVESKEKVGVLLDWLSKPEGLVDHHP